MGLFERIKSWFRRKPRASPTTSSSPARTSSPPPTRTSSPPTRTLSPPPVDDRPLSEGDLLVQEHEQLESERSRLRKEITMVDSQYSSGEIEAGARDRAYRMRLARAGQISMRQLEIRSQLVEMRHPIPDEWGAIQIRR